MTGRPWLSIILAAGLGTRMKSAMPKVLHSVAGRPMVAHAAAAAVEAGAERLALVIGPEFPNTESAAASLRDLGRRLGFFVQAERLGTAHAVLAAREAIVGFQGDAVIQYGDTPLLRGGTLNRLRAALDGGADLAVLGFEAADPFGYGRLVLDESGGLAAIREEKDATPAERAIRLCNSGVMAWRAERMLPILDAIRNANAKGEYYLTDAVEIARSRGITVAVVTCPEEEVLGVNDRAQLAVAERVMQQRLRLAAMQNGATLIAPETVTLAFDTRLGRDVIIEPNVFFGPGVVVEDNVHIKANCHLEQAHVHAGAIVGPFARLRPGAQIGPDVRIGNFVEVKQATIEAGSKVNHLAYIGDARVGPDANIGAGTIVCNYDGFNKHFTEIGAGAFVGSNSALVAPVKIGDGAYIGTGSVVTRDIEANALALERSELKQMPGWAARFRARHGK
jgi:bifunctional UDP-N-acetylglucosamine pyrophosphorylase/glucosamine-1-phosphate N-acetyltransferase